MAGIEPVDFGDAVYDGAASVYGEGKACLGTDKVYAGQEPVCVDQSINLRPYHVGKAGQNLLDFVAFGKFEFAEVVVELYYFGGLQIGGLAGGRFVMDEPFDFAAVSVEHGNDQASVANGHLGILGSPTFMLGTGKLFAYLNVYIGAFLVDLSTW